MWEAPPFADLVKALEDPTNPIGMRMRAAYFLRQAHTDHKELQDEIVQTLGKGLLDERHGSLMRHEFAYVMGQLRDERCCETLQDVLLETTDCIMVRHECAEALGAIDGGAERSSQVLETVKIQPNVPRELSETCQLALDVMHWRASGGDPDDMPAACACMLNPYSTVDPAPPHPAHQNLSMLQVGDILCNDQLPLFERYRAMFSLRNRGGEAAVLQLCRALTTDTSSPLLRHEVAYVLGQLQHTASVEALEEILNRREEHVMVRHESAEALGAIEGRWEDVEKILIKFAKDETEIDAVRESCLVALDAADYWGHTSTNGQEGEEADRQSFAKTKAADDRILINHFNVA
jgi:deoxyhypusine monooxygenase